MQVITRFSLRDFYEGVSDTAALRVLLEKGAQVRGVRNLHAKLYLFGANRAIVTSANLTDAALLRNHEFGFVSQDAGIVDRCGQYFDDLWSQAGQNLRSEQLIEWEAQVERCLAGGVRPAVVGLGDEGTDVGIPIPPIVLPAWVGESDQAFIKFFGEGHNRAARSSLVRDEVKDSGCHWACTYPNGKRPRRVKDGAVLFMGRLVKEPNDILVYGRAVGRQYVPGRDDASDADVQLRAWKARWPHYVRVHHTEFIAGPLAHGVSLNELMRELKSNAFYATQRNAATGEGNTDPRKAYLQQAAVELSAQGTAWLNESLEAAFTLHGKLSPTLLEQLDWPSIPDAHGVNT